MLAPYVERRLHSSASQTSNGSQNKKTSKVGYCLVAICVLIVVTFDSPFAFIRKLEVLDVYFTHNNDGPYGSWSELYKSSKVDYIARSSKPSSHSVPPNHISFVLPMLECPELDRYGTKEDAPPNEMFYDMISILKYNVLKESENQK